MLWQKGRSSDNVVDGGDGGGGGPRFGGGRGLGLGGIIVVVIVGLLFGKNPSEILQLLMGGADITESVRTLAEGSEVRQ